ncbi:recombination protein NinB [Brenneria goodwinii]|uniref:Phage NinB DNA recombination n=1 Tax=Brenneria goodwinii TaxID=1109412 RepID=A0A0G4K1T3_9GAMM|nr:recombination protein NinB [Brenneria goodwinii]MCG8155176.1 recombination protein NinB [Brenneria goodwinii]MCG8159420.1 recombination protein NinB [Brenneria goodwinii]MCG8164411.1 recombination protein NinB [Brenneria goodwinii]MCG8169023.1 recombination protein NinB [Brenneria goodwinii]MCG8173279.1 recombination protein NinB [Brenneria goodwinii]
MKQQFHLASEIVKQNAINFIRQLPVDQKRPLVVDIKAPGRTAEQNRKMWPLLKEDLSDQVIWFGNKYDTDDWKDLITAMVTKSKRQKQRMAPGLDGGVVIFGQCTSKMNVRQMVEVIEANYWFGTQQNVIFSEKSKLEIKWAKRWGEQHG